MMIHYLVFSVLHIAFSVVELSISALLAAISVLLASFEDASSILFELVSDLYGIRPRASFPTEKCAILILGAQEGVGRNAALSFSELGYTVFALCPNRQEESGNSLPSARSRDVASLLYIWHNRKERSRSIPWGLVAPMQLNLWSRSQREAVHETVRAHCNTYDLHLVALVISHDSKPLRGTSLPFLDARDATEGTDISPETHIDEDAWRISVLDEVIEPVLMAYDYKTLLAEASGRVIVLSDFAEGSPLSFLSLMSRTTASKTLAEILEPQGIRVSSIYFGPLSQYSGKSSPTSHSINSRCFSRSFDWQGSFGVLTQKISQQLMVQDNLLLTVLRRVVQSRHPKFTYTIGVYPLLRLALGSVPVSARIAVKSLMRWTKSLGKVA
ncbi:hypothetical protein BJV74DRAFT_801921 [Russula compacta]|nr:hypothetical protein BJV74DRAFT_801921 [Russula compacta]